MASTALSPLPSSVEVPFALLFSKELTPAAKFVWIRMRMDELRRRPWPHRARLLAKRTGLARSTVYEALRQGLSAGWLIKRTDSVTGKESWKTAWLARGQEDAKTQRRTRAASAMSSAWIPVELIRAAHALRPQAILCYAILQATLGSQRRAGSFKWAELRDLTGLDLRTIRRSVRALVEARWISIVQKNRRARIFFRLRHADDAYREEIASYLEKAGYVGEAMMRSYLSLIADTNECEDGARPGFLVNPDTGERMELDRYYPVHRVAFEFNGKQHYVPTEQFTRQQVTAQRKRDRLKKRICEERGIKLVVVHAEDLSLTEMLKKVGNLLPRRALRGFRRTIQYLDFCAQRYKLRAQPPAGKTIRTGETA